jgi:phenylacetate-CoA ligase
MKNVTSKAIQIGLKTTLKSLAGLPYRQKIEASWTWDRDTVSKFQTQQFGEMYNRALREIPYYRNASVNYPQFTPQTNLIDHLSRLPLLPKAVVKEHNAEFWRQPGKRIWEHSTIHTTSGTTGTALQIPATVGERGFTQAVLESWFQRICGKRWPKVLALSGFFVPTQTSSDEIYSWDPLTNTVFLSIYSLSAEHREAVIALLQEFKPQLIFGYSSAVAELARLAGNTYANTRASTVAVVTSEVMHEHQKSLIQETIAGQIFNLYGSQEGAHFVTECSQGSWHAMPMSGIVEIVDENGAAAPRGTIGRVAVTALSRRSMPLFRYLIGDTAMATDGSECPCALGWPTIGRIEGRSEDLVRTRDGRKIGMLGYATIRHQDVVKEAQLIQRNYERFECKLVLDSKAAVNHSDLEARIKGELERRIGYTVEMSFGYQAEIPRGARGKFKAVVVDFESTQKEIAAIKQ